MRLKILNDLGLIFYTSEKTPISLMPIQKIKICRSEFSYPPPLVVGMDEVRQVGNQVFPPSPRPEAIAYARHDGVIPAG
jgi:hypothetical protein